MTFALQVKLYPRLSIDSARRVRQLSQNLNRDVLSKCGKRAVKHFPRIAGPWLAGAYDSDRAAAKAAYDGLTTVLSSPDKITGLKKAFQGGILEYCKDALLNETAKTLSDERSVSVDDAEATYARVVASSLNVATNLLTSLPPDETSKQLHFYEEILDDKQIWTFAYYSDAGVRRAMHRFVQTALKALPTLVESHTSVLSTTYLYKGLISDQTGSSLEYVQALSSLTASIPQIWTSSYTGKKTVASRLRHFLKNGSYAGPGAFWSLLSCLLAELPKEIYPTSQDDAAELLGAARDGVTKREERANASVAWKTYYNLAGILSLRLPKDDRDKLLQAFLFPVIRQYLDPSPETADWSITGPKSATIVSQAASAQYMSSVVQHEWPDLGEKLVETAKMSQPQQSKDFEKSQLHVAASGERWANLQREIVSSAKVPDSTLTTVISTNTKVLAGCIALLQSREGKPFGAAAIIEEQVRKCGSFLLANAGFRSTFSDFIKNDLPTWMQTPARRSLILCLFALKTEPVFAAVFEQALHQVVTSNEEQGAINQAVHDLLPSSAPQEAIKIAKNDVSFQEFASGLMRPEDSQLFSDLLSLGVLTSETIDSVLSKLTASISTSDGNFGSLSALEIISSTNQSAVQAFMAKSDGESEQLLPNVIRLEQSPNEEIAERAAVLSARLSSVIGNAGAQAKFGVVLRGLQTIGPSSPSVESLHDLTSRLFGPEKHVGNPSDVLPSLSLWATALVAAIEPPSPSLGILSPLGGAVNLLLPKSADKASSTQLDHEGLSQALRLGMYVARLSAETDLIEALGPQHESRTTLLVYLYLTVILAEDNLSLLGVNNLWHPHASHELEPSIMDFISEATITLGKYWQDMRPDLDASSVASSPYLGFTSALEKFRSEHGLNAAVMYYHALALSKANSNLFELHGYNSQLAKGSEELLRRSRSKKNPLDILTRIIGFQLPLSGSSSLTRYCNELVADLTGLEVVDSSKARIGFERLVILNAILQTQEDAVDGIAKQRLIFLVKHLLPLLTNEAEPIVVVEMCKLLSKLLLGIQDMYGEHWSQVLSFLVGIWSQITKQTRKPAGEEEDILLIHATLKLYSTLRKLGKSAEPNDDLVDAQNENEEQIYSSLIQLLKSRHEVADEAHQPLQVTNELLAREIGLLNSKSLKDADELYPLIYAPSRSIQSAAFTLLHKAIPAAQEQISFDAALDNKPARLPDELLSLLLEAPTLESLPDAPFDRTMPSQLQSYLYSWRLFFDHFNGSSYRVKNDYIDQLKDGAYLSGLLGLAFDFLGHTRGRPVDASKFDIQNYIPDTEPTPEKDVQWLLIHLYFCALTHLPSSVKSYYLDIHSRQTSQAVDSWTAKYISPLIVTASLEAVAEWAEKSVKEDPEYEKMSVKVGMRSKEIVVSYVVDEQIMAIKVVLPEAYPLAAAQVMSVNRVAVKEEKWQSWLRNCQGVIIFSVSDCSPRPSNLESDFFPQNGSISDGLSAWRKNVTGALKGQSECAICYSIISGDKQLPTKRCPTCKHLFHGSCLHKWFKTSNASTCPLCRNPFSFN